MKKLPLMFLTVAAAACLTFSFTACGGGNPSDSSSQSSAAGNSDLVSDKLTSLEEWNAVFDGANYNNFTASATSVQTSTSSYTKTSADGTTESSNSVQTKLWTEQPSTTLPKTLTLQALTTVYIIYKRHEPMANLPMITH